MTVPVLPRLPGRLDPVHIDPCLNCQRDLRLQLKSYLTSETIDAQWCRQSYSSAVPLALRKKLNGLCLRSVGRENVRVIFDWLFVFLGVFVWVDWAHLSDLENRSSPYTFSLIRAEICMVLLIIQAIVDYLDGKAGVVPRSGPFKVLISKEFNQQACYDDPKCLSAQGVLIDLLKQGVKPVQEDQNSFRVGDKVFVNTLLRQQQVMQQLEALLPCDVAALIEAGQVRYAEFPQEILNRLDGAVFVHAVTNGGWNPSDWTHLSSSHRCFTGVVFAQLLACSQFHDEHLEAYLSASNKRLNLLSTQSGNRTSQERFRLQQQTTL